MKNKIIILALICINLVLLFFLLKYRKRTKIPKPSKRFTTEEDAGEITIEYARLQELILYMFELENFLEK